jgi:hypothetical protein
VAARIQAWGNATSRHAVMFEDVASIAVHLGVAAGGQAGQPGPNDD